MDKRVLTLSDLKKANDEHILQLGILKNAFFDLKASMHSQREEIIERDQAIAELQIDNDGLKDHNERLLKKTAEYEALIFELQAANRLESEKRRKSIDDEMMNKRKEKFQRTLYNQGCKEAWSLAKRFKRQGFSNMWISTDGYRMCRNCCEKKDRFGYQCEYLQQSGYKVVTTIHQDPRLFPRPY